MSARIPSPSDMAQRYMAAFAQARFRADDGSMVTLDPTAPSTFEQVLVSAMALSDYETYLYIRDRFLELMPTTATAGMDGLLPQHGQIWGVPRLAPQTSIGKVVVKAAGDVSLPQATVLTRDGSVQWELSQPVSLKAGESKSVSVLCQTAGKTGNLPAGTSLSLVGPVAGIDSITVDEDGLAGGTDLESVEDWRTRIIDAIRNPYNGGDAEDYRKWATSAGAKFVNVVPSYTGLGTVGVIIAFAGPRVPTDEEVARVQAYIEARRPIIGHATVYPVELVHETPIVRLGLDNQVNRDKITAAFQAVYNGVSIGGTLYVEALQAALYNVVGGASSVMTPTGDITYHADQMPVMDSITWYEAGK